ncbi:hypothetical protein N7501_009105 [Penicillium viridicatum]|nr:hypothetical protein N7501_009105 [Penicillium viridicatum]
MVANSYMDMGDSIRVPQMEFELLAPRFTRCNPPRPVGHFEAGVYRFGGEWLVPGPWAGWLAG